MAPKDTFQRDLQIKQILLEEVAESLSSREIEEVTLAFQRISEAIKDLELAKDKAIDDRLNSEEETIESLREWSKKQKEEINPFKEMRGQLKERIRILQNQEQQEKLNLEKEKQRSLMEEAAEIARLQQQEQEMARKRQMQMEEEWMKRKLQMEREREEQHSAEQTQKPQAVKLQKYTITPFQGDYKDWLRFWNQFSVEVDGSGIAEISKFIVTREIHSLEAKTITHCLAVVFTR